MSQAIKVATYNIRKAVGLDQRRNPERILAVLKEIDADIIALQEVDRRFGARVSALPLAMLCGPTVARRPLVERQTPIAGQMPTTAAVSRERQMKRLLRLEPRTLSTTTRFRCRVLSVHTVAP